MQTVQLLIRKKNAPGLISFLKELDFVEVKEIKGKNNQAKEKLAEIFIPAANAAADITGLFGAWKDSDIEAVAIRKSSGKAGKLKW